MQNIVLTLTLCTLMVNDIIVEFIGLENFWVMLTSGLLYCFAQCFIYNYIMLVHHRIFKEAKAVKKEIPDDDQSSEHETTIMFNDISLNVPSAGKVSAMISVASGNGHKSHKVPQSTIDKASLLSVDPVTGSEELRRTNSFFLETTQGFQIILASNRPRSYTFYS